MDPVLDVIVSAGPDAGRVVSLPAGRHRVGRADGAGLRLADPAVEAHHGRVHVALDGTGRIDQLAGRIPILVDDRPGGSGAPIEPGTTIEIGHSRLLVAAHDPIARSVRTAAPRLVGGASRSLGREERQVLDRDAMWSRRAVDGDAFEVGLGVGRSAAPMVVRDGAGGEVPVHELPFHLQAAVDAAAMRVGGPVVVDLAVCDSLALVGPGADGLVRSIVRRLAWQAGPAEWQLAPVLRAVPDRGWVGRLPHLAGAVRGTTRDVVDPGDRRQLRHVVDGILRSGDDRRIVVWCDDPAALDDPDGPLRRLLGVDRPVTALATAHRRRDAPEVCRARLVIGARWRGRWDDRLGDGSVHLAGCSVATAAATAAVLARPLRRVRRSGGGDVSRSAG